jgi:hypothetical protein
MHPSHHGEDQIPHDPHKFQSDVMGALEPVFGDHFDAVASAHMIRYMRDMFSDMAHVRQIALGEATYEGHGVGEEEEDDYPGLFQHSMKLVQRHYGARLEGTSGQASKRGQDDDDDDSESVTSQSSKRAMLTGGKSATYTPSPLGSQRASPLGSQRSSPLWSQRALPGTGPGTGEDTLVVPRPVPSVLVPQTPSSTGWSDQMLQIALGVEPQARRAQEDEGDNDMDLYS